MRPCLILLLLLCGAPLRAQEPVTVHPIEAGGGMAYLAASPRGVILVDAGTPGAAPKILRELRSLGRERDLKLIFLTHAHFDHSGSAAAVQRATGAPIAIHPAEAADLAAGITRLPRVARWGWWGRTFLPLALWAQKPDPAPAQVLVKEGDSLDQYGVDARVVELPGHTDGSCGLLLADRSVFVGDLISGRPFVHVQRYYASDWRQIARSMEKLKALNPARIWMGHGRQKLFGPDLARLKDPPESSR